MTKETDQVIDPGDTGAAPQRRPLVGATPSDGPVVLTVAQAEAEAPVRPLVIRDLPELKSSLPCIKKSNAEAISELSLGTAHGEQLFRGKVPSIDALKSIAHLSPEKTAVLHQRLISEANDDFSDATNRAMHQVLSLLSLNSAICVCGGKVGEMSDELRYRLRECLVGDSGYFPVTHQRGPYTFRHFRLTDLDHLDLFGVIYPEIGELNRPVVQIVTLREHSDRGQFLAVRHSHRACLLAVEKSCAAAYPDGMPTSLCLSDIETAREFATKWDRRDAIDIETA